MQYFCGGMDQARGKPPTPALNSTTRPVAAYPPAPMVHPSDEGVFKAAPEFKPNRLMATATANSKKLDAPIMAPGAAIDRGCWQRASCGGQGWSHFTCSTTA